MTATESTLDVIRRRTKGRKTIDARPKNGSVNVYRYIQAGLSRVEYLEFRANALALGIAPADLIRSMIYGFNARMRVQTSPASEHTDSNTSPAPAGQEACARYPRKSQGGTGTVRFRGYGQNVEGETDG